MIVMTRLCLSAHKVLNGANQSEVYLQEEKSKNPIYLIQYLIFSD